MNTPLIELILGIPREAWGVLGEMAPYLLFGFAMAGILSVFIPPETVERQLGKRSLWSVFKATVFGIPLPLCSCSVIPVAASLRKHGATRGATAAFLLSTPQTGVDSIMVTLGLLGPVVAIFRPIVALIAGLAGGSLVAMADSHGADGSGEVEACEDACCASADTQSKPVRAFRYAFITLPEDIGKALLSVS